MKIDPKLVEQWLKDCNYPFGQFASEYIAQRAADHALEEAAQLCERYTCTPEPQCTELVLCAKAIRAMKGEQ